MTQISSPFSRFQHHILLLALSSAGIFLSPNVGATDTQSLDTIVVTATRTEKRLIDSPIRTEVITQQELQKNNATTLKDALRNVAGVQLREIHGKSGYEISLQGLSSDQVLILIDGLPLAASTSSTVDLDQYLVGNIERIEVVKGATSAQYGSSAMGGVINIITAKVEDGVKVTAQLDGGSYGKQNANGKNFDLNNHHEYLNIEAAQGAWKGRISADQLNSKGFAPQANDYTLKGDITERQQFAAYAAWQPSDQTQIWLDVNRYNEKDQQRDMVFVAPFLKKQNKQEEIERTRLSSGANFTLFDQFKANIKGVHEQYDTHSVQSTDGFVSSNRESNQKNSHISTQLDLPKWQNQNWQVGMDWHLEQLQQNNNGKFEMQGGKVEHERYEFFAQNDIQFTPELEAVLGLRYQDDQDFGDHSAFKVSGKYRVYQQQYDTANLRLSFGQGYRVPNLKERFYSFDHSHLGYMVIGNPNLKPESSDSYQLGFQWVRNQQWNADFNLFYNDIKNLIQTDYDNKTSSNGIDIYSYSNIDAATTQGLESTAQWFIHPAVTLNAAYTYTEAKDKKTDLYLTRRPKHIARLGADFKLNDQLTLNLQSRYQSSEYTDSQNQLLSPDWFAVDGKLEYQISPVLSSFVGIDNIFNEQRNFNNNADFRPVAGRYSYMGLRFNWNSAF